MHRRGALSRGRVPAPVEKHIAAASGEEPVDPDAGLRDEPGGPLRSWTVRLPPVGLVPVKLVLNGTPTVVLKLPPPVQVGGLPVIIWINPSNVVTAPPLSVTRTE